MKLLAGWADGMLGLCRNLRVVNFLQQLLLRSRFLSYIRKAALGNAIHPARRGVLHHLGRTRAQPQRTATGDAVARRSYEQRDRRQLKISEQTVKNHVHNVMRKVGARDRLAAVRRCEVELFLSEATGS